MNPKINKLKILYVVSALKNCGPINILYNIISHLDMNCFEVRIFSLSFADSKLCKERFESIGCQVMECNYSHIIGFVRAIFKLKAFCRDYQPDIIHSHGLRPDVASLLVCRKKTISTLHNNPFMDYSLVYGKIRGFCVACFHLFCLNFLKRSIACSQSIFFQLTKYRLTVFIQNGIDDSLFHPANESQKFELIECLKWRKNALKIIVTAVVIARKNMTQILQAVELLKIPYHLIILGDGDLLPSLKNKYKSNCNIEFRGFCKDVLQYLQSADVYVSASRSEGLPCSVIEAMLTGLPVILSDIPSHREVLRAIPEDAQFLFPLDDPEKLSKLLEQIYVNKSKYTHNEIANYTKDMFSASVMSKKYADMYIDLKNSLLNR